jgi:hypothetical protein
MNIRATPENPQPYVPSQVILQQLRVVSPQLGVVKK